MIIIHYLVLLFFEFGIRGGKIGANGKMQYNPGWESGYENLSRSWISRRIVQDRMGGSFGAGFLSGSLAPTLDHQDIQRICLR
ncbi:hypothetical protein BSPWISOXPB_7223 [uncultured Gammaproteobacteria bacterium]|nr:hypothetical protein BSPWISOXPB_7223 [uncultured Gammaproteobacteria bacterium]